MDLILVDIKDKRFANLRIDIVINWFDNKTHETWNTCSIYKKTISQNIGQHWYLQTLAIGRLRRDSTYPRKHTINI